MSVSVLLVGRAVLQLTPIKMAGPICPFRFAVRSLGEPLRDNSGVKFAFLVVSAQADHPITVLNLAGINDFRVCTEVLLTNPLGRAVVMDGLLDARAPLTNGKRRFILIVYRYNVVPPSRLRGLLLIFLPRLLLGGRLLL